MKEQHADLQGLNVNLSQGGVPDALLPRKLPLHFAHGVVEAGPNFAAIRMAADAAGSADGVVQLLSEAVVCALSLGSSEPVAGFISAIDRLAMLAPWPKHGDLVARATRLHVFGGVVQYEVQVTHQGQAVASASVRARGRTEAVAEAALARLGSGRTESRFLAWHEAGAHQPWPGAELHCVSRSGELGEFSLRLSPEFLHFQGNDVRYPILSPLGHVALVRAAYELAWGTPISLRGLAAARFAEPVVPHANLMLMLRRLRLRESEGPAFEWVLNARDSLASKGMFRH